MKYMVINRKYITILCIVFSVLLNSGCSVKRKIENQSKPETVKYGKEMIECPENFIPAQITSCDGKDGIYIVFGREYGVNESVWYLDNNGVWNKEIDLKELFGEKSFCAASVSGKGELFVTVSDEKDNNENKSYFYIDENKDIKKISNIPFLELHENQKNEIKKLYECNDNYITTAKFIDNMIYAMDCVGNIYEIDKSSDGAKCVYENETNEQTSDYIVRDKIVIACSYDTTYYEGIENHDNEKQMSDKLESFLKKCYTADNNMAISISDNSLWTMCGDRIGRYDFSNDTSVIYKAFGYDSNLYLRQQAVNGNILYSIEFDKKKLVDKLYKHESGKEYIAENGSSEVSSMEGTLKIWSLYESQNVENLVTRFSDTHPNIDVTYEVGIDTNSGMTVDDIVKKLNTEVLAGTGPDIIYIDGLPIGKYVSGDSFCDLSDVITTLEGEEEYYNDILEAYKDGDNIYAVPSSFCLVSKIGTVETIEVSSNYNMFVDYVEQNKNVIKSDDVNKYIGNIYYRDIQEKLVDGSLGKDELSEYFDNSKKLSEILAVKEINIDKESIELPLSTGYSMYDAGMQSISVDYIWNVVGPYISMNSTKKECDVVYQIPATDFQDKCFLMNSFGISSATSNNEEAKEYLKYVLSYTEITYTGNESFPIKKSACEILVDEYIDTHSENDYFKASGSDAVSDECKKLLKDFDGIKYPIIVDDYIDDIVFEQLTGYLNGNISKEDATNSVFEKLNIYISE